MIIFLIINGMVVLTAYLLTSRIFKIKALADFFIAMSILCFSQIVLTQICLGFFGRLFLKNAISLNFIIFLTAYFITRDLPSSFSWKIATPQLLKNKLALFLISITLGFGLVKVLINLVNPPFGWDSLNYHFTFAVEWLKNGNLNVPITIFDDPSPSYYPINGSLLYLWLIFPFKNVFLADLGQLPFFILSFLSVYSIARKIGLETDYSFYSAALFLIIPNFFKQLSIAYVDVMVAGLFLACVTFLFLLQKDFSFKYTILYSLGLGLLIGTKTIALPYGVLLCIPFIYLCLRKTAIQLSKEPCRRGHLNVPYGLIGLLVSIAVIFIFGGFSYARNFFEAGNPLYPLDFRLFGRTIFKGVIDSATYRAHFKPEDYRLAKMLFHEGLGAQSLIFILPGIFLALPIAIFKKRKPLNFAVVYPRTNCSSKEAKLSIGAGVYFLILPILVYLVYRYLIPLANIRYLYAVLGLGMVLGLYTAEGLSIPKRIINILVFLSAFASMSELAKRQELVVSIILTLSLFFLSISLKRLLRPAAFGGEARNDIVKRCFIFILFLTIFALIFSEHKYIKNEFPGYEKMVKYSGFWPDAAQAWVWLNDNTSGNNIAYVGRPVPFPLYGTGFKNNVYYVSVNKIDPAKLHYFSESHYQWGDDFLGQHRNFEAQGNYRSVADYSLWLKNLLRRNTDYLFVYSLHQTKELVFPLEDAWAKEHPGRFKPVFANKTIHIYKVIK